MTPIALEYHDVSDGPDFDASGFPGPSSASYKLALRDFEAHVRTVAQRCRIAVPPDAFEPEARGASAILTFDDGGVSASTVIAPLLESLGARGVFLVTTDFVDRPGFLTRAQVRELHERGHVIGSHSCSHPLRMAACSDQQLRREWQDSVALLRDIVGDEIHTASVPGGYFSRAVAECAAAAGIRFLFTSEPVRRVDRVAGCLVIGRFTLRRWHGAPVARRLVAPVSGARAGQWLRWNALKVVKRAGGGVYLKWRERLFGDA